LGPDLREGGAAVPSRPAGAPLVPEPPDIAKGVGVRSVEIAEARDVDAVGPATLVIAVEEPRNVATRADAEVVVHEIATEGAAVPSQSVGVLRGLRVEQQPRAPQCRGAQEDDARKDLVDVAGGGVDEPNAGN